MGGKAHPVVQQLSLWPAMASGEPWVAAVTDYPELSEYLAGETLYPLWLLLGKPAGWASFFLPCLTT